MRNFATEANNFAVQLTTFAHCMGEEEVARQTLRQAERLIPELTRWMRCGKQQVTYVCSSSHILWGCFEKSLIRIKISKSSGMKEL